MPELDPASPQDRATATYNAAADHYAHPALSFWDHFGERTVDRLSLPRGARVLDVCCGAGASALAAAARVGPTGEVVGVDLAEQLMSQAREKAARAGLTHIQFRRGDLASLDQALGVFDAVVCVFGVFFVPDMTRALSDLWQRVRPGGVLAVTTWAADVFEPANTIFWDAVRAENPSLHKAFNPWDRVSDPAGLASLFAEAGVPDVHIVPEPHRHPLRQADDWWAIVLGSGYRGTVDQLPPESRERGRAANLHALDTRGVSNIGADVLYATARRQAMTRTA